MKPELRSTQSTSGPDIHRLGRAASFTHACRRAIADAQSQSSGTISCGILLNRCSSTGGFIRAPHVSTFVQRSCRSCPMCARMLFTSSRVMRMLLAVSENPRLCRWVAAVSAGGRRVKPAAPRCSFRPARGGRMRERCHKSCRRGKASPAKALSPVSHLTGTGHWEAQQAQRP